MPHPAFDGQTPDEIYFGRGKGVPEKLARGRVEASRSCLEMNRKATCSRCPRGEDEEQAA